MLGLKCLGFLMPVVPVVYTIQEGTPVEGFPKLRTLNQPITAHIHIPCHVFSSSLRIQARLRFRLASLSSDRYHCNGLGFMVFGF